MSTSPLMEKVVFDGFRMATTKSISDVHSVPLVGCWLGIANTNVNVRFSTKETVENEPKWNISLCPQIQFVR